MASRYYVECPDCGALLDPGERCDCEGRAAKKRERAASSAHRKDAARVVEACEVGNGMGYDQSKKYYREWYCA